MTFSRLFFSSVTEWERQREKDEFSRASVLYRPLNSLFADRFTPATNTNDPQNISSGLKKSTLKDHGEKTTSDLESNSGDGAASKKKQLTIDEEDEMSSDMKAAKMGMYGKLTRTIHEWHPDKLLCKRFNIPDPYPGSRELGVPGRGRKSKGSSFFERDFFSITSSETTSTSPQNESMETNEIEVQVGEDEDEFSSRLKKENESTELVSNKKKSMKIGPLSHLNRNFGAIDKESGGAEQVVAPSLATIQRNQTTSTASKAHGGAINSTNDKPPIDIFKAIFDDSDTSDSSSSESEDKVKDIAHSSSVSDKHHQKDNPSKPNDFNGVSVAITNDITKNFLDNREDNASDNLNKSYQDTALDGKTSFTKHNDCENMQHKGQLQLDDGSDKMGLSITLSSAVSSSATSVYRPKQVGPLAFLHHKDDHDDDDNNERKHNESSTYNDSVRDENDKRSPSIDNNDNFNEKRERELRENMLKRAHDRENMKRDNDIKNRTASPSAAVNDDELSTRRRRDDGDTLNHRGGNRESSSNSSGADEWTEKATERESSRKRRDKRSGNDDRRHRRNSPMSYSDDDVGDKNDRSSKRNKTKKSKHKKSSTDKKKKSKKAKKQHKSYSRKKKKSNREYSSHESETDSDEDMGKSESIVPSNKVLLEKLQQYRAVTGKRPSAADFM